MAKIIIINLFICVVDVEKNFKQNLKRRNIKNNLFYLKKNLNLNSISKIVFLFHK